MTPVHEVESGIEKLWTFRLPSGIGTHYSPVCGLVEGEVLTAVPGQALGKSTSETGLFLVGPGGELLSRTFEKGPLSPFLAILQLDGEPCIAYWSQDGPGPVAKLLRLPDLHLVWKNPSHPWAGNGDFLNADVNGDGKEEIIFSVGGQDNYVICVDARSGEELWRYEDRVTVCWGRTAVGDIDADGELEIVFGTEYGNPDGTSSLIALSGGGELEWRYDKIRGDAGSTPALLADVDGDGCMEVLKVEIDLCGRDGHISELLCFDAFGKPKYSLKYGGSSVAVGDIDGDGILEGVGLTQARDGGNHHRSEAVCFDLQSPRRKWATKVPRVYLSGDPVIADLSETDGLETLITTGMPSGYGRIPGQEPWGRAYLFSASGDMFWSHDFPDWAGDPLVCDVDGDARNEFMIPSYEGRLCAWKTAGIAMRTPFPVANAGPLRLGCLSA